MHYLIKNGCKRALSYSVITTPFLNRIVCFSLSDSADNTMLFSSSSKRLLAARYLPHLEQRFLDVTAPLCIRVSNDLVAFTGGAVSKTVSDHVFARMSTKPFLFGLNIDAFGVYLPTSGVCSLTVAWSC